MAVKYIETQFLDGTLTGPREMASSLCTMYTSPREKVLDIVKDIPHRYGLYILLGKTEDGGAKAYIGQTKDFQQRVRGHLAGKSFWDTAIVFISNADRITSSEALYLEYLGIQKAIEAGSYNMDENAQVPPMPPIAYGKRIEMDQFFDEILFFLKFYGCTIFEKTGKKKRQPKAIPTPLPKPIPTPTPAPTPAGDYHDFKLVMSNKGVSAKIRFFEKSGKFVLLAGSTIAADNGPSLRPSVAKMRADAFMTSSFQKKGTVYEATTDFEVLANSPSTTASFCVGTSRNGATDLVDESGKTYKELYKTQ